MLKALIFLAVCVYYTAGTSDSIHPLFRQKRSEDTCRTTSDSRNPGAKCVFPFKFKGKTYNGCPPDLANPGRGWCSTQTDSNGNHVSGQGNYGFCENSCPTNAEMAKTSCNCQVHGQPFTSCAWSKSMFEKLNALPKGSPDRQVLSQKFQSQICDKKSRKVCCQDGKPHSDLSHDLVDMEKEDVDTRSVGDIGYYPSYRPLSTGAGCAVHWKESLEIEFVDNKTTVCTTVNVHTCWNKTVEECKFLEIEIPFTEVIDVCVTKENKVCKQAWACLDDGWTKDKDTEQCNNEVYQDSDDCLVVPEDICTKEEKTFMRTERKRVCNDIPYQDCDQKVPTETCVEEHVRYPVTYKHTIPYKVCGSD